MLYEPTSHTPVADPAAEGWRLDEAPTIGWPEPPDEDNTGEEDRDSRVPVGVAVVATIVLVAVVVLALATSGGAGEQPDRPAVSSTTPTTTATTSPANPSTTVPGPDVIDAPDRSVPNLPTPLPDIDRPGTAPSSPGGSGWAPTPVAPPPPPPPAPEPLLAAQGTYSLDPGVLGLTIVLENDGDAPLHYELANNGDGYHAPTDATGEIVSGATQDVWIDLDATSEGDGPTTFTRTIEVTSDGGTRSITVDGQVEKPGHLEAVLASMPFVDYAATVELRNVGELPLDITGVDHPGLKIGPLPEQIAAGETIEVEVKICATVADQLPVFVAPAPFPAGLPYQYATTFELETDENSAATTLNGSGPVFDPPSCTPVFEIPDGLTLGG
ncbi:MAG: hypothetical protein S0880_29610 [Actinomycetota bacterium]|nr:hypothetical protein [Actinomycetota bacterium]